MKGSPSLGGLGKMRMILSDEARPLVCFPLSRVFPILARVSCKIHIAGPYKDLQKILESNMGILI